MLERPPELGVRIDNVARQLEGERVEMVSRLMETLVQRPPQRLRRQARK